MTPTGPTTLSAANLRDMIGDLIAMPGALLPVLHRVQEKLGYIPGEAVAMIARELNLSRADVHGVITFYHDFRQEPPGACVVKVCQAEACQAMGAEALTQHARSRLGAALHETSADRAYTLEPIYCLGNCALSPAIMLDGQLHGRVSAERFDALIAAARQA
jgi:formate dehydrogenase subunit gamma